ncbi:MAG TPA: hypothetical protein VHR86_07420 [Armatimonadota bacterium]|nr:hypothetical protein [Armatimonadota bacterium]
MEQLCCLFCRHEWIRERRDNGKLGQRCMKCMKRREHDMLRLIEWKLDYNPIEPAYQSPFPQELPNRSYRRAA